MLRYEYRRDTDVKRQGEFKGGKEVDRKRENMVAIILILPACICLGIFNFFPIIRNFILSFSSWNMVIGNPKYIGVNNYIEMFTNEDFWSSIIVTIKYTIMYVPMSMMIGFVLAILIKKKNKVNLIYRSIFFLPYVTSMVAISAVFLYIYHPQYGSLNMILQIFGIEPIRWLNTKSTALISLVIMNCWKSIGMCVVIFLGSLLNISDELREAARIDGAGEYNILKYVEIPLVTPATFMLVIMLTIESFKVFTQISVMTQGGPDGSTTNLLTYMFQQAFEQFRVGYGGAIAIVLLLIVLIINLIQMKFEKFVNYDL